MHASQSNTEEGIQVFKSAAAITKNRLVQLVDATGRCKVQHPAADGGVCQFVALETVTGADLDVPCQPLTPGRTIRVESNATIAGAVQVMAQAATGRVIAVVAGAAVYSVGITQEDSVDTQLVEIRPLISGRHTGTT